MNVSTNQGAVTPRPWVEFTVTPTNSLAAISIPTVVPVTYTFTGASISLTFAAPVNAGWFKVGVWVDLVLVVRGYALSGRYCLQTVAGDLQSCTFKPLDRADAPKASSLDVSGLGGTLAPSASQVSTAIIRSADTNSGDIYFSTSTTGTWKEKLATGQGYQLGDPAAAVTFNLATELKVTCSTASQALQVRLLQQ